MSHQIRIFRDVNDLQTFLVDLSGDRILDIGSNPSGHYMVVYRSGPSSVVEGDTVADRRYLEGITATTTAPTAAEDGFALNGHTQLQIHADNQDSGVVVSFDLYLWYPTVEEWIKDPTFGTSGTWAVDGADPQPALYQEHTVVGATRAELVVSGITGSPSAGTDVWITLL